MPADRGCSGIHCLVLRIHSMGRGECRDVESNVVCGLRGGLSDKDALEQRSKTSGPVNNVDGEWEGSCRCQTPDAEGTASAKARRWQRLAWLKVNKVGKQAEESKDGREGQGVAEDGEMCLA